MIVVLTDIAMRMEDFEGARGVILMITRPQFISCNISDGRHGAHE